jgi:hypothetical protein
VSWVVSALAASTLAFGEPGPQPEYHLVDMVVAQVDATVITLSRLVSETRLMLLREADAEVARASSLSQDLLNTVLGLIVQRELLLGEVRRLKLRDIPESEVEKQIAEIKLRFATDVDYERFLEKAGLKQPGAPMMKGLDAPPSLVAILLSELQASHFLSFRVGHTPPIRESDVKLCYEANRARFGDLPITDENVKKAIEDRIKSQERTRARRALIDQLARRATIRYADKFEPPAEANEKVTPFDGADAESLGFVCPERRSGITPP